ncbi:MAG: hypothetical protein E7363_02835 [Clostridiales bacterium]|nr:hypothetical protein [Clostridiales bacterium]
MKNKVLMILIDGMRVDGLKACGSPYLSFLEKNCAYTYHARSVFPSITLPCHYSITHSIPPQTHGIINNTFTLNPDCKVNGIFEVASKAGKTCAFFYGWEPLRDIARPGALRFSTYINAYARESGDAALTDACERLLSEDHPDFAFLYMVETDEKGGHDNGWMSEEYLRRIRIAIDCVYRMITRFGEEYHIVLLADHGGHDRGHGSDLPEDMTIPMFFSGKGFAAGEIQGESLSLLDIAPTIADILGVGKEKDWQGKSFFNGNKIC